MFETSLSFSQKITCFRHNYEKKETKAGIEVWVVQCFVKHCAFQLGTETLGSNGSNGSFLHLKVIWWLTALLTNHILLVTAHCFDYEQGMRWNQDHGTKGEHDHCQIMLQWPYKQREDQSLLARSVSAGGQNGYFPLFQPGCITR